MEKKKRGKKAEFLDLLASSGWSCTTRGFIGFICSVAVGSSYCDGLIMLQEW